MTQQMENESIDWGDKFVDISNDTDSHIIQTFINNIEMYLYLAELIFRTTNVKLIRHLHRIIQVLYKYNSKYFFQIDLFVDESIPVHPLAHFVKLSTFCNVKNEDNQDKMYNVLHILQDSSFLVKKEFIKIIVEAIKYMGENYLSSFSKQNLSIIEIFFNDYRNYTDTQKIISFFILNMDC